MKAKVFLVKMTAILALFAGISTAGVKYVAVVETEVDSRSGASANLTPAEVALITAELRREAVNNLPPGAYNIMTTETVYAQGGAVLEECADENCVITLGSKIGADYIVRGTISKFGTMLTLSVEVYETENGSLVASSDPVRSEKPADLLEMATAACANMYKKFVNEQNPAGAISAGDTPGANNRRRARKVFDKYIALKYELPLGTGTPVSWGGADLELGFIWGRGAFFGIDISVSMDSNGVYDDFLLGGGFILGNVYDFGYRLYLVYGGAAGFWVRSDNIIDDSGHSKNNYFNFLAPFVKLRWMFIELTYRGLLGIEWSDDEYRGSVNKGFNYNQHQVMIGFYFATSKRTGARR
jgi:hypothetical protein